MRNIKVAAMMVLCAALAGCAHPYVFDVTSSNKCPDVGCNGIPFYTKTVACKHETVWLERTYMLTLAGVRKPVADQKDAKEEELFEVEKEIAQNDFASDEAKKVVGYVLGQPSDGVDVKTAFWVLDKFNDTGLAPYKLKLTEGNVLDTSRLTLSSNRNEVYAFVDYANPYYFNARKPFSGSVNPEIDLGPDLTLSKASVNLQEDTFKTAMSVVSSAAAGIGVAMMKGGGGPPQIELPHVVILKLTIESRIHQYTLSALVAGKRDSTSKQFTCEYVAPLTGLTQATTFTSTLVAPAEGSKDKADGGNTLKFSGSVELPKTQPQKQPDVQPKAGQPVAK